MNDKFLTLRTIYENDKISQREIAKEIDISLGKANSIFKELVDEGLIEKNNGYIVTKSGLDVLNKYKVDNAVILASGMGLKLAPSTYDIPKSFIEVDGETLIERQIKQLKEKGIDDITIMVGFLKEKFEPLIDKYNVKLIYNDEYQEKNTLATLIHAKDEILNKNTYICVSDVYMKNNIFHRYEFEPYYSSVFLEEVKNDWQFITNSKSEILGVIEGGKNVYCMLGHAFFTKDFSEEFLQLAERYYKLPQTDKFFWEDVLVRNFEILPVMYAYRQKKETVFEFDTLKDLNKHIDDNRDVGSFPYEYVAKIFGCSENDIRDVVCINNGMTNNTYKFGIGGNTLDSFICRVVRDETNKFINRSDEKIVYEKLLASNLDIFETVLAFDEKTGTKISKFFDNANKLNIKNEEDMKNVMGLYRSFHNLNIKVDANIDVFDKINECLSLLKKNKIVNPFDDFDDIYKKAEEIYKFLKKYNRPKTLTHGNASPQNILIVDGQYKMIDFEYAGMADPLYDIALFAVYSDMNHEDVFKLLDYYMGVKNSDDKIFENITKADARNLVICYMALTGLYNCVWAICRASLSNADYGYFDIRMYRHFKEMYKYLNEKGLV